MATNIKYLKENNLFEAHKHFMRLCEGYMPLPEDSVIDEDGEQEENQDPNADPMAGGGPMPGGADPGMGGGADPMAGGDMGMDAGGDGGMGGDPGMDGGVDPMAGGDMGMDGDMPPMDGEDMGVDDGSTIDIDGLTKAQERLNVKQNQVGRDLSKVDQRMMTLMDTIEKLTTALDANNTEIENLKAEFEKRNPTQTEKLNLRSLDSYPFNVKPTDYWAEKNKQGGYEAYADNQEPTTKEYVITNDDVDNVPSDIADTFFKVDDDDIQTLDKIFRNF